MNEVTIQDRTIPMDASLTCPTTATDNIIVAPNFFHNSSLPTHLVQCSPSFTEDSHQLKQMENLEAELNTFFKSPSRHQINQMYKRRKLVKSNTV